MMPGGSVCEESGRWFCLVGRGWRDMGVGSGVYQGLRTGVVPSHQERRTAVLALDLDDLAVAPVRANLRALDQQVVAWVCVHISLQWGSRGERPVGSSLPACAASTPTGKPGTPVLRG